MNYCRTIFSLIALVVVGLLPTGVVDAATIAGQDYTFQVDDQLSRLAEKYYGSPNAYPALIEGTNTRATEDGKYAQITDPNHSLVGQTLFVQALDEVPPALLAEAPLEEGVMVENAAAAQPSPEQLQILASLDNRGVPPELFNEVWLNSDSLKLADLRGKVVIIEFWTYG